MKRVIIKKITLAERVTSNTPYNGLFQKFAEIHAPHRLIISKRSRREIYNFLCGINMDIVGLTNSPEVLKIPLDNAS